MTERGGENARTWFWSQINICEFVKDIFERKALKLWSLDDFSLPLVKKTVVKMNGHLLSSILDKLPHTVKNFRVKVICLITKFIIFTHIVTSSF